MRLHLRIETPVHIGNGERLGWLDWTMRRGEVGVLDWGRIVEAALERHEDVAERLAAFAEEKGAVLEETARKMRETPGNRIAQLLLEGRRRTDPAEFPVWAWGDGELGRRVASGEFDRYRVPFRGGRLDRRLTIFPNHRDDRWRPTVSGSTLRGALRTAVAHAVLSSGDEAIARAILEGDEVRPGWERELAQATPGRSRYLFGEDVEAVVFRPPRKGRRGARLGDPRFDLMRFVWVSDALDQRAEGFLVRASPFAWRTDPRAREEAMRPAPRGRPRAPRPRRPERRPFPLSPMLLEALEPGACLEYDVRIDIEGLRSVARGAREGRRDAPYEAWFEVLARAFGLDAEETAEGPPERIEERVVGALETALQMRARALIERERRFCERFGIGSDEPLARLLARLDDAEGALVRIGVGAGLHGLTVLPALEEDPRLGDALARALARAGLGLTPQARRERAERERRAIEQARGENGSSAQLDDELVGQRVDPRLLPVARRFTMRGGSPDEPLGLARLVRGPMPQEEPPEPPPEAKSEPRPKERPRREEPPDRPATKEDLEKLLRRFGPRH